jgi:hypothetical protein
MLHLRAETKGRFHAIFGAGEAQRSAFNSTIPPSIGGCIANNRRGFALDCYDARALRISIRMPAVAPGDGLAR